MQIKYDKSTKNKYKHEKFNFYVSWIYILLLLCFNFVQILYVPLELHLDQDDDITQERHKCESDAAKTPMFKCCHSLQKIFLTPIICKVDKIFTLIKVGSFINDRSENTNLTEKHRYKQGRPGGVGGGWQEERHPGRHGEHGGGDEVHVDILGVAADQVDLETYDREKVARIEP